VHNLEDGGVVVQYNCECPELAEQLKKVVQGMKVRYPCALSLDENAHRAHGLDAHRHLRRLR